MAEIVLDGVSKIFSGDVRAVDQVNLTIEDGEFLVLVGPSGCGKTTLLRMIAGLETPSGGTISIGDEDVTDLAPRHRDIAMVFQNYALYPHMSVKENLAYSLKVHRAPKQQRERRVGEVARLLGLEDLLDRKPSALSGGQRQRVAMGRAIVREPRAFLMDEPLSNLDAKLRVSMRAELARLHERLGVTTVYVTHDQVEAMTLGQRVAVLREGRIQQLDRPQELYNRPVNLFVAAFIGSPAMNLVEATVDDATVTFGGFRIPLSHQADLPERVILGIRPEAFADAAFADARLPRIEITASVVEDVGADVHVIFPVDAPRVESDAVREATEGEEDTLLADDRRALFNARLDPRTNAQPGRPLQLSVDPRRLHFFDLGSGKRIEAGPAERELDGPVRSLAAGSQKLG